jgi:hypothetical protein
MSKSNEISLSATPVYQLGLGRIPGDTTMLSQRLELPSLQIHLLALLLAALLLGSVASAQSFTTGRYIGTVQTRWDKTGRTMTLVAPFEYVDSKDQHWIAPKGSVVDGASIPKFAWSIIGGPFEGLYRDASVIHDIACDEKTRPWNKVHENFYWAMLTSGVDSTKAKIMYAAVYHFGPRWVTPSAVPGGGADVPPENTLTQADFDTLRDQIESRDRAGNTISLREIRSYGK